MHFSFITALALLAASAVAEPIPKTENNLDKRADNWCKVATNANCRQGPGEGYGEVKVEGKWYISTDKRFGVQCTREGSNVKGDTTWDYIPGWNCWVSAYLTRSAGSQKYCETGLPKCPRPGK
ncbi:hypothetical protein QBC34DRAFT_389770 [Podospora aff. communis PSN243]|uniref:Uncharacterized protein n=1 Tax=Podospora aff. communis PSN243 TaxID=3040156 RepID=A0AAV9H2S6_9PEZI|nr:hypothetical protein QBC34DRAFT_389770 [Podospora aff. communis PSN243]